MVLLQALEGPVLENFAVIVTPRCVDNLTELALGGVPGDEPVDEIDRVFTFDVVFIKGGNVDESGTVSNRLIFRLIVLFISIGCEIAGPMLPVETRVERRCAGVEWSSYCHGIQPLGGVRIQLFLPIDRASRPFIVFLFVPQCNIIIHIMETRQPE